MVGGSDDVAQFLVIFRFRGKLLGWHSQPLAASGCNPVLKDSRYILRPSGKAEHPDIINAIFSTIPHYRDYEGQRTVPRFQTLAEHWVTHAIAGVAKNNTSRMVKEELTIEVYAFLADVMDRPGPVTSREGKPWRFHFDPAVVAGIEYQFPPSTGTALVISQTATRSSTDAGVFSVPRDADNNQWWENVCARLILFGLIIFAVSVLATIISIVVVCSTQSSRSLA